MRYTIKRLKEIARNYEEYKPESCAFKHDGEWQSIIEMKVDFDRARAAVGKDYKLMCEYLNGKGKHENSSR